MATNTPNYGLIKPGQDDFYNVDEFNSNADIIDTRLKENADTADYAKESIDSLDIGGRNYLLGTSESHSVAGNAGTNQLTSLYKLSSGTLAAMGLKSGDYITLSYEWSAEGSSIIGSFQPQFNNIPWTLNVGTDSVDVTGTTAENGKVTLSSTNTSGRVTITRQIIAGSSWLASVATSMGVRMDDVPATVTLKFGNWKFEKGSRATDWTPAPEDFAPIDHASSEKTYGIGTSTKYGHAKLSDSVDSTSGADAGVAASPAAVKKAYELAETANNKIAPANGGYSASIYATDGINILEKILADGTGMRTYYSQAGVAGNPTTGNPVRILTHITNGFYGWVYAITNTNVVYTNYYDGANGWVGWKSGAALNYLGAYNTLVDLQSAQPTGSEGDAYLVDGDIYIWTDGAWVNGGTVKGANGTNGKSAYEIAQASGYPGTEEEWLKSLKEIDENSVSHKEIVESDFYTPYEKWDELTSSSDGTGNWCNNFVYPKGHIKNIKVKVNGTSENTGKVFIYQCFDDGSMQYKREYDVTGAGLIAIEIDRYIEYNFMVSTRLEGVAFKSVGLSSGTIGSSTSVITPNFNESYTLAVGVEYEGIYSTLTDLEYASKVSGAGICKIVPYGTVSGYPVVIDFENMEIRLDSFYLIDESGRFKDIINYRLIKSTLELQALPSEDYYIIYIVYNLTTNTVETIYSNGETLNISLLSFENKLIICYGFTNGRTYFSFGGLNEDFVKVILKQSINTDATSADDKIIPKFGEKLIITRQMQTNKWFGKKANFLGDSVTKGENSADSYLRMQDDNIASITKEEFGFAVTRNYGAGGACIAGSSASAFINRYADMDADADLIVVWGGTNDFGGNVDIGTLDLSDLSDNTKFKTAFYNLVNGLMDKYPGKQLLVLTPMHRNDGKPDNVANTAGYILKDYRDAEIEIAEFFSVPVLDMWSELGGSPFNDTFKSTYMPDGLHPNILGMRTFVGRRLCDRINNL